MLRNSARLYGTRKVAVITTWELPHRHVGRHVEIHERLESTNTLALERGRDPTTDGLALLARAQPPGGASTDDPGKLPPAAAS